MKLLILLFAVLLHFVTPHSIVDFGAIPNDDSVAASETNTRALVNALLAANASSSDRTALIPAGSSYYIFTVNLTSLYKVNLQIEGVLIANNNITHWHQVIHDFSAVLYLTDSHDFTISGNGAFDGQGYVWWWDVILGRRDWRPHLIRFEESTAITIVDVHLKNSPQFHVKLDDCRDIVVRNVDIDVDVTAQQDMLTKFGHWWQGIPTFPLNTDGFDPAATNVLIENVRITNFDDAVAVKPCKQNYKYCTCSSNIYVRNAKVRFGVGMTIGSVPPNDNVNCVRDVVFENVEFTNPFKAIYIKSNPGDHGTGIIHNITYRNIHIDRALWYPIWIGPQQQKQPGGGADTGCSFLFPIDETCPTQPRVTMSDIVLTNVTAVHGLTLPGVILCDPANPCTGFQFNNVQNSGLFVVRRHYYCKNAKGSHTGTDPDPCF
eukprot:TRINITY_DN885_c0_g1_i1.p1 TRINITY_DN885_c0_g1~~TRINITY_DN885_c0_g1_i1.p1  ORF type:complete len:433 (+),score=162.00 TRINITY_DN885_c0_g1_i1:85-1383(+)